jgi:hypothetical protein
VPDGGQRVSTERRSGGGQLGLGGDLINHRP